MMTELYFLSPHLTPNQTPSSRKVHAPHFIQEHTVFVIRKKSSLQSQRGR